MSRNIEALHLAVRPELVVHQLGKSFGQGDNRREILRGVDLRVLPGELVSIVGPSGTGKTTLLRCLAGLLSSSHGEVRVGGRLVTEPPAEIGLVFQDYSHSLLPWMKARENVAFPLQGRGVGKAERDEIAQQALASVDLKDAGDRYPWQLSGGMQQRVAIARALAYKADILLMDEPFASVDAQTRFDLEDLVLDLQRRLGLSIIVVTHDIDEAVYLSHRVVVLSGWPATVIDTVEVSFPEPRDQIATRSDPRFANYRAHLMTRIRRPASPK